MFNFDENNIFISVVSRASAKIKRRNRSCCGQPSKATFTVFQLYPSLSRVCIPASKTRRAVGDCRRFEPRLRAGYDKLTKTVKIRGFAEMIVKSLLVFLAFLTILATTEGLLRRCFTCRSRGDLGTCKDPFTLNGTQSESMHGVEAVPCASGWCAKMMEGGNTYKDDDYGIATQRMCLQRGPSDNEERCAYTVWNYKKVYMCFCSGDLCNGAPTVIVNNLVFFSSIIPFLIMYILSQ